MSSARHVNDHDKGTCIRCLSIIRTLSVFSHKAISFQVIECDDVLSLESLLVQVAAAEKAQHRCNDGCSRHVGRTWPRGGGVLRRPKAPPTKI